MIETGKKVSLEYTVKTEDGTVVDTNVGDDPLVYQQGENQILPAIEEALEGLEPDASRTIRLEPDDAYGDVDPRAFQSVEPGVIPEDSRSEGTMLMATDREGNQQPVRVHEIKDDQIVLDFNHPLAGKTLDFEIKVLGVE